MSANHSGKLGIRQPIYRKRLVLEIAVFRQVRLGPIKYRDHTQHAAVRDTSAIRYYLLNDYT